MRIPENHIVTSPFMGNYFCLIDKYDMAFIAIAKNGMTFLKNIAIKARGKQLPENEDLTHKMVGFTPEAGYLIPVQKMCSWEKQNKNVMEFAVWRDPVERLISTYKFFCLEKEFRNYWHYLDLYHDSSFERFMEFVVFELKKSHPLYQDEHIRRQVDYYRLEDVDYIVPIEELNHFLQANQVCLLEEKSNTTSVAFDLPDKKWIDEIRKLYKADYNLMTLGKRKGKLVKIN